MFSSEFSTREYGGRVVVTLRRALGAVEAARPAAALMTVAVRTPEIIADLEFPAASDAARSGEQITALP
jgi:hypothetical protein